MLTNKCKSGGSFAQWDNKYDITLSLYDFNYSILIISQPIIY